MKVFTIIKRESERIPGKNFQEVGGQPLWRVLLSELKEFDLFVNTDCKEILQEQGASDFKNLTLIERNAKHIAWEEDPSNATSPVISMTEEFIRFFVTDPQEIVVLTHVTSPFLSSTTLIDAASFLDKGYLSVHSVTETRNFCWKSEGSQPPQPINFDPSVVQRTQDLAPILESRGAFFIFRASTFISSGMRIIEPCYYYPLSAKEGLEVDFPGDLSLVREVAQAK